MAVKIPKRGRPATLKSCRTDLNDTIERMTSWMLKKPERLHLYPAQAAVIKEQLQLPPGRRTLTLSQHPDGKVFYQDVELVFPGESS